MFGFYTQRQKHGGWFLKKNTLVAINTKNQLQKSCFANKDLFYIFIKSINVHVFMYL